MFRRLILVLAVVVAAFPDTVVPLPVLSTPTAFGREHSMSHSWGCCDNPAYSLWAKSAPHHPRGEFAVTHTRSNNRSAEHPS